jgi:hypothetical protein
MEESSLERARRRPHARGEALPALERCRADFGSGGARVPLSDLRRALLEEAEAAGHGAPDNSAIIEVFERKGVCRGNETDIH